MPVILPSSIQQITPFVIYFLALFFLPQNTNNDKTRRLPKSKREWRGSPKINHGASRHLAPSE